ncbi:MAG: hypothetical protein KatS3mg109_1426 [Pirellulaceae bacterium]|nr:MAG: hypothetical protein KatS3mg109_1426 [Pirellulaceae bacterium]
MLSFSVDVPRLSPSEPGALQQRKLLEGLLQAAEQYSVPITWAVADWHEDWLIRRVMVSGTIHEFAVLAGEEWAESRRCLVAGLSEAKQWAAAYGVDFEVLALRSAHPLMEMDVLVRHRIRVVRGPAAAHLRHKEARWALRPLSARFGIWYAPVHAVVGKSIPWWWGGSRSLRLRIAQLVRHRDAVHVTFDVGHAAQESVDLAAIARSLFRWAACRGKEMFQVALLSQVVRARAAHLEPAAGMHSVLRRSA